MNFSLFSRRASASRDEAPAPPPVENDAWPIVQRRMGALPGGALADMEESRTSRDHENSEMHAQVPGATDVDERQESVRKNAGRIDSRGLPMFGSRRRSDHDDESSCSSKNSGGHPSPRAPRRETTTSSSFRADEEAENAMFKASQSQKRDSVLIALERMDAGHPPGNSAPVADVPSGSGELASHAIAEDTEQDPSWVEWQRDANQGRGPTPEGDLGKNDEVHPWSFSKTSSSGSGDREADGGAEQRGQHQGSAKEMPPERSFRDKFSGSMLSMFGLQQPDKTGRSLGSRGGHAGDTPSSSNFQSLFSFKSPKYVGQEAQINEETPTSIIQEVPMTLKDIFDKVAAQIQSQNDSAHITEWEDLYVSITGSRDKAINVSAELGETMVRLGISIPVSKLQETICEVCQSRGREPDDYHGTGVSLKTPVYHELNVDEFVDVMRVLTRKAQSDNKMIEARRIFTIFDIQKNGFISVQEFWETLRAREIESGDACEYSRCEMLFKEAIGAMKTTRSLEGSHLIAETALDFASFLTVMGLEGSNENYFDMETEDLRRRLLEALTTFHTFDEDGGGSIDALEIKATMRAMGQKISDEELLSMIAIADPQETGEIDFEHFCYVVLSISRADFSKMIKAHIDNPVQLDENSDLMSVRRKPLQQLCPDAFIRAFSSVPVPEEDNFQRKRDQKEKDANFVPQDFGQYALFAQKHPLLDENSDQYRPDFVKRALSRPLAWPVYKTSDQVTCAAFCPSGLKIALTTSEGCLRLFDVRKPKSKQVCFVHAHNHVAMCLAWLPDGSGIVTGGADWAVSMWSGEDLSFLGSEVKHLGYVRSVATSHEVGDKCLVASGSSDLNINIYHAVPFVHNGKTLEGHTSWIRWLHFSHDNKRLISGGDDQAVIIWNMTTFEQMQTLRAHSHTVAAGASLPTNRLYTAGFDENLLLWSQDTGLLGYLKVFVAEAFDLPRGDMLSGTMSNQRFVRIELGKGQSAETKFKSGRSPGWYEEFDMDVWNVDESVNFEILDWDKDEQHRLLGTLAIPLEDLVYADDGITDREYDLLDEEGNPSKQQISLRFTFRQVQCVGELTVGVEKAKGLPRMDTFGLADPFAAVTCGKGTRHKTKVIKNTLSPVWNDEFVFNVEESARELKIMLYDWSFTKEEDFIGQVVVQTSDFEQKHVIDDWFRLKDMDGQDAKGELKLKIRFMPESERDSTAVRFRRNPASWPVGEKADFDHYAPVGQIKLLGRTILRGKCKHCKKRRWEHTKNLRCDLGTGNYFHSLAINSSNTLMACGTGDGRVRISRLGTGQQIACWTAHAGPVLGLHFASGDDRLISCGPDVRSVSTKDFTHGSYNPADTSQHEKGKRCSVEVWYVTSMVDALESWRKKYLGISDDPESPTTNKSLEEEEEEEEEEDHEIFLGNDEDDDEDESLTPEERAERKRKRHERLKKQEANALRRRKGRGGNQNGALPGAKVGFTPVHYEAPVLFDGRKARSCIKGRGRREVLKTSLVWTHKWDEETIEIHFYPPEHPDPEGDSDDSAEDVTPTKRKPKKKSAADDASAGPGESAAEKKRIAEQVRRERARLRKEAKDSELFGKSIDRRVGRTGSNESSLQRTGSFEKIQSMPLAGDSPIEKFKAAGERVVQNELHRNEIVPATSPPEDATTSPDSTIANSLSPSKTLQEKTPSKKSKKSPSAGGSPDRPESQKKKKSPKSPRGADSP